MSIKALDWAMDAHVNDPLAKLVLIVVANHHNDARGVAWPSVPHICKVTGASDRTVRAKLKKLEETGFLIRNHRSGRSTEYTPAYVAPLQDLQDTPAAGAGITIKEPLKDNKRRQKLVDWKPTDDDRKYAIDLGLDPDDIFTSISLWNEQNGNKAAYVSLSAFWKGWCRRVAKCAPRALKRDSGRFPAKANGRDWLPGEKKLISPDEWRGLSEAMQKYYLLNRPDAIDHLRKSGLRI